MKTRKAKTNETRKAPQSSCCGPVLGTKIPKQTSCCGGSEKKEAQMDLVDLADLANFLKLPMKKPQFDRCC